MNMSIILAIALLIAAFLCLIVFGLGLGTFVSWVLLVLKFLGWVA
jgi:hypothetical protein